ncbi:MAG: hypothetical protein M1496_03560 [Candidatus Thermoplasmatota archaeon]|jgi:hypothetical protein|nr:hypothetical protein [Candidatus Thermoplasmatota archaeon]
MNIARNGHVAPIPKDLTEDANEATQKFFSYPFIADKSVLHYAFQI